MAKRSAVIRVESLHDGERMVQELNGEWYVRPDGHVLRYAETDPSMGRTMTMIKCSDGEVRISRQGDSLSEFIYRDRAEAVGRYRLPDGWAPVRTRTRRLQSKWSDAEGMIRIDYVLRMADQPVGRFELTIRVQAV